jgi:glycerol-3-phosphate dehydrogenase (NAD(P)+)
MPSSYFRRGGPPRYTAAMSDSAATAPNAPSVRVPPVQTDAAASLSARNAASAPPVTILGNGGWGAAMALILARRGISVTMWGHDSAYLMECARTRRNRHYLPGVEMPASTKYEPDRDAAVRNAGLVLVVVPTRHLRATLHGLRGVFNPDVTAVSLSKGIERATLRFPSAIIREETGANHVAVLSGPTMAEEVAHGLPASITVAHPVAEVASRVQAVLSGGAFRVYASNDRVGVELAGAAKNVIAIATGICDGMKMGDNGKAALLARGIAELRRLGRALGANDETFMGLAGVGDLYTTCASPYGRNRGYGERLGKGLSHEAAMAEMDGMIVEGADTADSLHQLAARERVEMPICDAVYQIIYRGMSPREALTSLLSRELRPEHD